MRAVVTSLSHSLSLSFFLFSLSFSLSLSPILFTLSLFLSLPHSLHSFSLSLLLSLFPPLSPTPLSFSLSFFFVSYSNPISIPLAELHKTEGYEKRLILLSGHSWDTKFFSCRSCLFQGGNKGTYNHYIFPFGVCYTCYLTLDTNSAVDNYIFSRCIFCSALSCYSL